MTYQNFHTAKQIILAIFLMAVTTVTAHGQASPKGNVYQALDLALLTTAGQNLKRADLSDVLYRPGDVDQVFIVTKFESIYFFRILDAKAYLVWHGQLVSSDSPTPLGALGAYFGAQGKRLENPLLPGEFGDRNPGDELENPFPLYAYKVLSDGTLKPKLTPRAVIQRGDVNRVLNLVLRSADWKKLKRTDLSVVLYYPSTDDQIYLVTKSNILYSFSLLSEKMCLFWHDKLVSSASPKAYAISYTPMGVLGNYFELHGMRLGASLLLDKNFKGLYLNELESPYPMQAYNVLKNGTLKADMTPLALTPSFNASQFLRSVLHSPAGQNLKRSDLSEVFYRPGITDQIYLVTKSNRLYSFWASDDQLLLFWKANLVPSASPNAYPPSGALGYYLEQQGKRIANPVVFRRVGGPGLQDEWYSFSHSPLQAYKVQANGKLKSELAPLGTLIPKDPLAPTLLIPPKADQSPK